MSDDLLLVDDHRIFLKSLQSLLSASHRFTVVGCADSAEEGLRMAYQFKPALIMLDFRMYDSEGGKTIVRFKRQVPTAKILMLTADTDPETLRLCLEAGCDGYAIKNDDPEEIELLMKATLNGHRAISWRLGHHLVNAFLDDSQSLDNVLLSEQLSEQDRAIIRMTVAGKTASEIAACLNLESKRVVEYQRAKLRRQTGYQNLTAFAQDFGLVG